MNIDIYVCKKAALLHILDLQIVICAVFILSLNTSQTFNYAKFPQFYYILNKKIVHPIPQIVFHSHLWVYEWMFKMQKHCLESVE